MTKYIPLLSLFFLFAACNWPWKETVDTIKEHYPDDNPVEEAVEEWIHDETGVEVDFTGSSEEEDPYNKSI